MMRLSCTLFALSSFAIPSLAQAGDPEPAATPTPTPEAPRWERGGYFGLGVAPSVILRRDGFAPGLRYDLETGFSWQRRKVLVAIGVEGHLVQLYARKKVGGGVDGVATIGWGPVYVRAGLGTMAGIPATRDLDDARPSVGGLLGIGLQTHRDHIAGRIGVDYDYRIDTAGRPIQTVLLVLRVSFG
ncbi:MAG TPA: hypothetical protein VFG69_01155 [Nannocystaceae bacterium]|nr:hypothetical protein [Nannocystaceae bacterium]